VSNAAFRDCQVRNNEGFELFEFNGMIDGVTLQDCKISKNKLEGAIFCFSNRSSFGLYVHNSSCTENQYAEISNLDDLEDRYFDTIQDNRIVPSLWASSR
jgi:hypothetical protein